MNIFKPAPKVPSSLPATTHDMHERSGMSREFRSIAAVKDAQKKIAEWIVTAAEEAYGADELYAMPDVYGAVWINAKKRWPDIESLCSAINDAERAMWRDSKQGAEA